MYVFVRILSNIISIIVLGKLKFTLAILFLDVNDVMYVINFDHPKTSEDYVHRIGRTGRCDKTGTSYTLFTPENVRQAKDLISVLEEAGQEVSQELNDLIENNQFSNKKGKGKIFFVFILKAIVQSVFNFSLPLI